MGIKLQDGNSASNFVNVNSRNQLQVVTPKDSYGGLTAGFVQMSSEVDAGKVVGTRSVLPLEASDDYRLRVGVDQTIFNATFESTGIRSLIWSQVTASTNNIQNNGFLTVNDSGTVSGAAFVRTHRLFPIFGTYPIYLDMWIRETNYTTPNAISEWGFLYLSTLPDTRQPGDGIFFRRTANGELKGIITNNSLDIAEITIDTSKILSRDGVRVYDANECNHHLISLHNDVARFWINDVIVGEIPCLSQFPFFSSSTNLPVGLRVIMLASTVNIKQVAIGYVNVSLGDQNVNKPWQHVMAGSGQGAYQVGQGSNNGPTVTRGTGALGHPTSGTTRIAGSYVSTTLPATNSLGGLWTSPAISTLTSDSDYPIFAYQNPTGNVALPGKNLYVTGARIGDASATVGATANGIFLSYIVQVENSASATSTADAATTTSGKATVIGGHGFAATDVAGTMKPGFEMTFNPPLAVPAGKYFTVIARPFGTVTSNTLVVTSSVAVNGYFE